MKYWGFPKCAQPIWKCLQEFQCKELRGLPKPCQLVLGSQSLHLVQLDEVQEIKLGFLYMHGVHFYHCTISLALRSSNIFVNTPDFLCRPLLFFFLILRWIPYMKIPLLCFHTNHWFLLVGGVLNCTCLKNYLGDLFLFGLGPHLTLLWAFF